MKYTGNMLSTIKRFNTLQRILTSGLFALGLFAFAGCDLGPTNTESGLLNQTLHVGNGTEPKDLDPHTVTGVPEHKVITALLEGLVSLNPITLAPEPGLAASWAVSDDLKHYTFELQANAKWSNGDRVTAEDFVWSWQRMLSPNLASEFAYQLFTVKNARQFNKGDITDFSQVGVKALSDKILTVELEYPTPYFLTLLAHYSTYAVHPPTVLAHGAMDEPGTLWTRAKNYVGNGPFNLKEWRLNYIIRVEKNPYYWDAEKVKLKEIRFYPIDSVQTEERMFRTGALHATNEIPIDRIAVYRENDPELLAINPYLGTYFYKLNTQNPPLDNAKVRRALSMSIDRNAIVTAITKGGQIPAYTLTPPDTQGYFAPPSTVSYNPEKARQLLAEAGFPNGEGFPALRLIHNTNDGHRRIAVAVQQMWKQVLNVDIELFNQDWKVYLSRMTTMDYQIARSSWIGDYPDPNTFLDMFVTDGTNNKTGWSNHTYDRLIEQAASTLDQKKRYQLFQQAEQLLMEGSPIIPIYTYTRNMLKHPDLQGWHHNVMDLQPYKYVYLQQQGEH